MKYHKFTFNPFGVNTYVIYNNDKALIIDPGCSNDNERKELILFIETNNLKPVAIINTHCHIDHIAGVDFLKDYFKIEFWAHKDDKFILDDTAEVAQIYGFELTKAPKIDQFIDETSQIDLDGKKLKILHVPGHTPGHLAFFSKEGNFVLTGDVLFKDTIGRTDLPGGDLDILIDSIFSKILPLGDDVKILPGHGSNSTIGMERKDNPFL